LIDFVLGIGPENFIYVIEKVYLLVIIGNVKKNVLKEFFVIKTGFFLVLN